MVPIRSLGPCVSSGLLINWLFFPFLQTDAAMSIDDWDSPEQVAALRALFTSEAAGCVK